MTATVLGKPKGLMSVATKVAVQMNCKLGGEPGAGADRSQARVAGGRLLPVSLCANVGLLWGACAQGPKR